MAAPVRTHEAYSLDSQFQQLFQIDDFEGASLKDLWTVTETSTGGGTGTAVVVEAQTGGIVRLSTDDGNDDLVQIDWGDIRSLLASKSVATEARITLASVADVKIVFGLFNDATHLIVFEYDTDTDTNWQISTDDGTGPSTADSGIAAAASTIFFRIEATATSVAFFINDVEVANSPITADIPTQALQPYLFLQTRTTTVKTLDCDYVAVRQKR